MYPKYYDPTKVGTLFAPRIIETMLEGRAIKVAPSHTDQQKVILLNVDQQVDFIHANGALFVPGAIDDTRRIIEWVYRNLRQITTIAASQDTHLYYSIHLPSWWVDRSGKNPDPFTPITLADYQNGLWTSKFKLKAPAPFTNWNEYYLTQLETAAKKTLMVWPFHCLEGTIGRAIEPSLFEAFTFHGAARYSETQFLTKGTIPQTEHYSILEPEVKVANDPNGGLNTVFLDMLKDNDLIYVAGQAKSHCVLETVRSILNYFKQNAPDAIAKLRILQDCTSPVDGFEDSARIAFDNFVTDFGLKLVKSTDPIG